MDHPRLHHKCPSTDLPLEICPKLQSKETNKKSPKNTQKIEKKKKMSGGRRMTAGLQTAAGVGTAGEAPAHIDLEGDPTDVEPAPPRRLVPQLLKPPRQHRPRFTPGARQHVRLAPRGRGCRNASWRRRRATCPHGMGSPRSPRSPWTGVHGSGWRTSLGGIAWWRWKSRGKERSGGPGVAKRRGSS